MTVLQAVRHRVLLSAPDQAWRRALRARLEPMASVAESNRVEEAVAWLEGREPGITFLACDACAGGFSPSLERLREMHPGELIVVVDERITVELCRAAMRGGAFDVLAASACGEDELALVLDSAGERLDRQRGERHHALDRVREAVRRHERDAAGFLVDAYPSSGAWADLDVRLRKRWMSEYLKVATTRDIGARARFIAELCEELAGMQRPGELLVTLHVHAMASGHGRLEMGMEAARGLLVDMLARVADNTVIQKPTQRAPSEHASDSAWHRWRLHGVEYWWLVLDGRLSAHVYVGPSAVEGTWTCGDDQTPSGTRRLMSGLLPAVPEALREVERRLGCGYVLEVLSSEES